MRLNDDGAPMTVDDWLSGVAEALPELPSRVLSDRERAALLDLARVAAHASHRTAAPLSAFLAGAAFGGLDGEARAAAIEALVARLDR